jgi:uracil permease
VTLNRAFNPAIMTRAAIWAICFSFVGKLGAVLQTIPTPVIGGAEIPIGDFALGGIGLAGVVGVLLNLVLPREKAGAADQSSG